MKIVVCCESDGMSIYVDDELSYSWNHNQPHGENLEKFIKTLVPDADVSSEEVC